MVRWMREHRMVLAVALVMAFAVACAPTFEGKLRQGASLQKTIFDGSQEAALGMYEATVRLWIAQVKAGTLSAVDYRAKRATLDRKMDDLAVIVEKGKLSQRALLDGQSLLEKGVGTQASLVSLQADFASFISSVLGAVDAIRAETQRG
ncbi:MAG: hypothetical protein Q7T26_10640 [Dehalococcoidia bacterium]|nr:hypothetical protein [Dehalococcoidia bacterium]